MTGIRFSRFHLTGQRMPGVIPLRTDSRGRDMAPLQRDRQLIGTISISGIEGGPAISTAR